MPASFNENGRDPRQRAVRLFAIHAQHFTANATAPRASPGSPAPPPGAYYAATQYILGIRPDHDGLRIDPCIPAAWKGFTATRRFRNKTLNIKVVNRAGVQKGVKKITLNGQPIEGNLVPVSKNETGERGCGGDG